MVWKSPEWMEEAILEVAMDMNKKDYFMDGMFWMFTVSIFVFWIPILGGLIAGLVGGWFAGRIKDALFASVFPAIIFGVALAVLALALPGKWVPGMDSPTPPWVSVLTYVLFLMVGAILGGLRQRIQTA